MQKSSNFGIKPATMRGIFMRIFPGFKGPIRVWKWMKMGYTRTSLRFIEKWVSLSKQNWEFTNQHSSSSKNWTTNSAQCIWSVAISLTLQGSSPNPAIAIWGYQVTQTFARWPGFHPYKSSKFGESSELEPGPLRGGSRSFWTSHFCIQFFTHQIPGKENMNKEVDVGNCTKKYFLNFTQKPTETIPTCILLWTSGLQPLVTKRDNSN